MESQYAVTNTYVLRKTKSRTKAVIRDPRLAGERNPSRAKIRVANVIDSSCTPGENCSSKRKV